MLSLGYDEWTSCVGLRYDEQRRVAKIEGTKKDGGLVECPLSHAKITLADVRVFWDAQPFDLQLKPHQGNCDFCFKKGVRKLTRLVEENPEGAAWWVAKEAETGTKFAIGRRTVCEIVDAVQRQVRLPMAMGDDDDEALPCFCTD